MSVRIQPPFRADHVGSLLRPPSLVQARDRARKGEITAAELRDVEDSTLRDAVRLQEDVGLRGIDFLDLTFDDQRAKLRHVVEWAEEIWRS